MLLLDFALASSNQRAFGTLHLVKGITYLWRLKQSCKLVNIKLTLDYMLGFGLKRKDCRPLKVRLSLSKKNYFIFFNENPLKLITIAFYFISKALLVLKLFKFLSLLFVQVEKRLDQKDEVNFKIYDITTWLTGTVHILPNIT